MIFAHPPGEGPPVAPAVVPGMTLPNPRPPEAGTRRRRLWELGSHAHCPVVGVCLPIAALRRLLDKLPGGCAPEDDYELHCAVVADSRTRNRVSAALQRLLEQRHQLAVRRAASCRSSEALAVWWGEAAGGHDLPGALWATLTHPRCSVTLETRVLGQVHMLQHQVGMATRVELGRFEALIDENAVLTRALAAAQRRHQSLAAEQARRLGLLDAQLLRARGMALTRETELALAREQLEALRAGLPRLREREALAAQCTRQAERLQDLQRELVRQRDEAQRQCERADALQRQLERSAALPANLEAATGGATLPAALADQAVLCVGGRTSAVPRYRVLVERSGARFLHHDGGAEHNPAQLDATLAAADLVICQTGCVSHGAYWRVKEHCKRTGKRCLFVETPSRAALERALVEAAADAQGGCSEA